MSELLHQAENNEDSQRHLQENSGKFETHCEFLLRLMKHGRRLSSQDAHDMRINDRRLRNLHNAGKCQREWKLNDEGKRLYVEYYIPTPKMLTKTELCNLVQKELF